MKHRKLVSIMLTLVMLLSLMPMINLTSMAANPDNVTVSTMEELKTALSGSNNVNITVAKDLAQIMKSSDTAEYWCTVGKGTKTLDLAGHKVVLIDNSYQHRNMTMFKIPSGTLNIKDSKGDGIIHYSCSIDLSHGYLTYRNLFLVNGGTLNLYSGNLLAGGSDNRCHIFGYGVCVQDSGSFRMYGGTVEGNGYAPENLLTFKECPAKKIAAVMTEKTTSSARPTVYIYDGVVEGRNGCPALGGYELDNWHVCGGLFKSNHCNKALIEGHLYNAVSDGGFGITELNPNEAVWGDVKYIVDTGKGIGDRSSAEVVTKKVSILNTSFPAAVKGYAYGNFDLKAEGAAPFKWEVAKGQLPAGIRLSADYSNPENVGYYLETSQVLADAGEYRFTLKATDALGRVSQKDFSLTVNPSGIPDRYRTAEFNAVLNEPVKEFFTWGDSESVCELVSGSLPQGITWKNELSTLFFSGTPTQSGDFTAVFNGPADDTGNVITTVKFKVSSVDIIKPVQEVSGMAITGLVPPAAGAAPVKCNQPDASECYRISQSWYEVPAVGDTEHAKTFTGPFQEGKIYALAIDFSIPSEKTSEYKFYTFVNTIVDGKDYPCTRISDYKVRTVIYFDNLAPKGELTCPFTDVPKTQWYYESVAKAYQMGLIDGMSPTTFQPDGNMTYAQAITLAARMNQKYTTGSVTLQNGTVNWYDTYVDYCLKNNIIDTDYASVINTKIDRHNYVHIFANALPDKALEAINTIPDGSIPDVTKSHQYAADVYKLYRAGILNGSKPDGTFNPESNIKRSEVATILVRMMDPSVRVGPPADLAH